MWYDRVGKDSKTAKAVAQPESPQVRAMRMALNQLASMVLSHAAPQYRVMAPICERWLRALSPEQITDIADATSIFAKLVDHLRADVGRGIDPDVAVSRFFASLNDQLLSEDERAAVVG